MNDRTRNDPLDQQARDVEILLGSLPAPEPAREEYASRLRSQFATGSIQAGPYADEELKMPRGRILPGPWRYVAALSAAAALFLIVTALNRGSGLEQIAGQGNGTIVIAGQTYPLTDSESFADRLRPGTEIEIEGDMSALLDLGYEGFMAVQITPGAHMTVPKPAGRWFGRTATFDVEHGEVRVVTGPDFAGAELRIDAPGAKIELVGTTIAVICSPCSTCVCVLEGTAHMTDKSGVAVEVSSGHRRTIFNDVDHPPMKEPIRAMERMKLQMLRDAAMPLLESEASGR